MADADDIREGNNFGVGIPVANQNFYVKGHDHVGWGMKNRLSKMFNKESGNSVMLAVDHGFLMGPTSGLERIAEDGSTATLASEFAAQVAGGQDSVVLNPEGFSLRRVIRKCL